MGETSIHSLLFISILVINIVLIYTNELGRLTVSTLGISIQYSSIQYQTRKSYKTRFMETIFYRSDRC